jgi:U4/U6 small nuclear ribonucleoprotein PRP3
MPDAHMEDAG